MSDVSTRSGNQLRQQLRQQVAVLSDGFAEQAHQLAEQFEGSGQGNTPEKEIKITQIRGLENVAYTTPKVSDILDLIKKQVGRGHWPRELGDALLTALGQQEREANRIARQLDPNASDLPRYTHLLLCREFIKHLAAHFVYRRFTRKGTTDESE